VATDFFCFTPDRLSHTLSIWLNPTLPQFHRLPLEKVAAG
jgi:hypothetical protein